MPADPAVFWIWFADNQARFRTASGDEKERLLDETLERLQAYSEDLYFEVGGAPGEPIELVVTAEGVAEAFGAVRALIAAAPAIEGWRFVALKPPAGFDFATTFEGARIDARRSWFMPLEAPNAPRLFGLRLACDDYLEELREDFLAAAHIVVETGLGELVAAERVQFIDVERTPSSPNDAGYLELPALTAYLDWRASKAQR